MEPNGILIYGETDNNGKVAPVVFELVSKSVELQKKLWNQRIMVCIINKRMHFDETVKQLGEYGCNEVLIVNDDRLSDFENYHSEIFTEVAKKYPPRIILIGATEKGKKVASYTATKLETGLTADCTNLDTNEYNLLLSTRPTFGGQLTADIVCSTFPQMATVQPNVFPKIKQNEVNINATYNWIDVSEIKKKIEIKERTVKKVSTKDITSADVIVCAGAGAANEYGMTLIYELAQKLNGAVAGTRETFEKGFISKAQQIGQTGKTVAPKLYIAVGVSGASQHIAGIKNSGKIIAINSDKNAPIFKYADIGIVDDLFKVLAKLPDELDK